MIPTNMNTDEKIRVGIMAVSVALSALAVALGVSFGPLDEIGGLVHH